MHRYIRRVCIGTQNESRLNDRERNLGRVWTCFDSTAVVLGFRQDQNVNLVGSEDRGFACMSTVGLRTLRFFGSECADFGPLMSTWVEPLPGP